MAWINDVNGIIGALRSLLWREPLLFPAYLEDTIWDPNSRPENGQIHYREDLSLETGTPRESGLNRHSYLATAARTVHPFRTFPIKLGRYAIYYAGGFV